MTLLSGPLYLELVFLCSLITGPRPCTAADKRSGCVVQDTRADCSHLGLSAIPTDLPLSITSLDVSHNRLTRLVAGSLGRYTALLHLDISYNSVTKLEPSPCQELPQLRSLNLQHNEVYLLKKESLNHCTNLTKLNLASNKLKLQGEPFMALRTLKSLDVSENKLWSAMLGSQPQLPNLVALNLGKNDFTTLQKGDFSFLRESPFLRVVNLSLSKSLKTLESGCLGPISHLYKFILDGSSQGFTLISKLSSELSGSSVGILSLRKIGLATVNDKTFAGLQNTNLTFLDLSANGVNKIDDGSFQWLPRLETLVLANNNIKRLTPKTFQGLKMLKKLDLTEALVKSKSSSFPVIDDFAFQTLNTLESLMLQNTDISGITENTFTGLTSLTELDLSWSSYLHTPQKSLTKKIVASLADSPLRKLHLTANALVLIEPESFSTLKSLQVLYLDRNFIRQTLSGEEFKGLGQLQEIHMSNNSQSINLTSESFRNVPHLRVLTLGKSLKSEALNQDPSPFSPLANLTVLDLSNNNIANIRESLLEGLQNLQVLKLQHNNLARLWKEANLGGPVLFLRYTPRLVTLEMGFNGLDEIPVKALKGLGDLRELNLGNNLLNNLKYGVFDDLRSLRFLSLEKNFVTSVRPEVFRTPMSNLSKLMMAKNPFDCTCESVLWFVTWLNTTNSTTVPGRSEYMCNTPLAYTKHPIIDFDPQSCKDMTPFQGLFILTSTAVMALMLGALVFRFHGWRIQFYWNILVNRTLGFSDARVEEGRSFEYDAYVIHAEEDTAWVERRIVPLENEKCKFCLEDRDSILGMSRIESIINNMRKSRKILFIVTERLLNDPWCRQFKGHHALHQVIEASRDSVVLLFLQDVHDYKLSSSLFLRRGMLRPCCVLDWPPQRDRVPAFNQKLFVALGMTNQLQQ